MIEQYLKDREQRINEENYAFFRGLKYMFAISTLFWGLIGGSVWYFKYHKKSGYVEQASKKPRTTL